MNVIQILKTPVEDGAAKTDGTNTLRQYAIIWACVGALVAKVLS